MSGFQGMDTAQGADLATRFSDRAQTLSSLLDDLSTRLDAVVGSQWVGPDADAFAATFHASVRPRFTTAVDAVRERGTQLDGHVDEQDATSSTDGSPGGGAPGGGTQAGPGAPAAAPQGFLGVDWSDISVGEVWQNWTENVGIDGVDSVGGIVSATHSFAKKFGDFALGDVLDDGTRVPAVPGFVPMIGDAFTGMMAGVDRWNDDASRSDLSTGERIGRAVIDGGSNFAGSLAGTAVGGAIGGSIGGLFGGAGGAVAGAPVGGAGAVPGAAAGGATGAGAGTVVGGIVGDLVGSYFGATTADAVIDAVLD